MEDRCPLAQTELYRRGLESLRAGRFEEATRCFASNEREAGEAAKTAALLRQADELLEGRQLEAAARLFESVLQRNPSFVAAYHGLARIALASGATDAARVHAAAASKLAPAHGLAWTLLGLVEEASGELGQAIPLAEKGARLSPGAPLCQLNLGRMLLSAGRAGEAVGPLFRATCLSPHDASAFRLLAEAHRASGQREQAIRALESAVGIAPRSVESHAALGDALFAQKAYREARQALDRGLDRCGDSPFLLEKALACAMKLEDWEGALRYVQRELAVVPHHERGWLNLAGLQLLTGRTDDSVQTAKQILASNPRCWEAWFHLGNVYEALPEEAPAEDAYRRAVAVAPRQWKPLVNLAALLVQLPEREKHQEAVQLLEQAQPLAPEGEWRATYNLALARARLGERGEALALAREVFARWPGDPEARRRSRVLESNLSDVSRSGRTGRSAP